MDDQIFLSAPDVRDLERSYVLDAIDSNWIAPAGPYLDRFEQALAVATDRSYAVALSSGTAAIHLALLQAGVKPGDTVLCSTLTFVGSVAPIIYCGAKPFFIDSAPEEWCMDPSLLERALTTLLAKGTRPSAAIVVDLYGSCARYDEIVSLLDKFEVPLIEDAAEALGSRYLGRKAGSFGESAILSFNGNKIITSSGGGAFVTNDQQSADRARFLSTQARVPAVHYEHEEVGFNYRMSNICAAIGLAQLERLDAKIRRRREIFATYQVALANIEGVEFIDQAADRESNRWLSVALLTDRTVNERNEVITTLERSGIESRPVWKPMHLQPVFKPFKAILNGSAERLFDTGICLPSGSGMSDDDIQRVITSLVLALRR